MKTKKLAIAGMSAALMFGAGGGFVMSLPTGASAAAVTATTPTDPVVTDSATATPVADDSQDANQPARGERLTAAIQPLVDAGTITAEQQTAVVEAAKAAHDAAETAGTAHNPGSILADTLAAQVTGGSLTQAQSDAIAAAVAAARPVGGGHGPGEDHGGRGNRGPKIDVAATALGITTAELQTELQAGRTIADVATAQGVDVQKVIDVLVADATTNITERITNMVNGVRPAAPTDPETTATTATTATTTG